MSSITSYQGFCISEQVKVKDEVLYEFLGSPSTPALINQAPVIDYIFRKENKITIAKIEFNPYLILQANFSFIECNGWLYFGQFVKCFPTLYILDYNDLKDSI